MVSNSLHNRMGIMESKERIRYAKHPMDCCEASIRHPSDFFPLDQKQEQDPFTLVQMAASSTSTGQRPRNWLIPCPGVLCPTCFYLCLLLCLLAFSFFETSLRVCCFVISPRTPACGWSHISSVPHSFITLLDYLPSSRFG